MFYQFDITHYRLLDPTAVQTLTPKKSLFAGRRSERKPIHQNPRHSSAPRGKGNPRHSRAEEKTTRYTPNLKLMRISQPTFKPCAFYYRAQEAETMVEYSCHVAAAHPTLSLYGTLANAVFKVGITRLFRLSHKQSPKAEKNTNRVLISVF